MSPEFHLLRRKQATAAAPFSDSPLWDWATAARWMFAHRRLGREAAIEAEIVREANAALAEGDVRIAARLKARARGYAAELGARE